MKTFSYLLLLVFVVPDSLPAAGQTEILKWQDGKRGAVSLTYDDGSMNQFRYALPIMRRLHLPATFYVITGPISGSKYPGKFIGRPVEEIVKESASVSTNARNYFERASAAKYLGYVGANAFYDSSAISFEDGKEQQAYGVMDELYRRARTGIFQRGTELSMEVSQERGLSWDSIKVYAAQGFEFASHTVTHAHMAVLDTVNMFYELQKSKQEVSDHLGKKYTFTAEIPFGIEHPRAMKYALPVYPALRNLMTDPYMQEINRGYKTQPGASDKEYVQWQRGATTKTSLELMKSWVDTTIVHDNIWLVLVFHGVDEMGYEALPHELLEDYFTYIKSRGTTVWVATFSEAAKYMRERMHASVTVSQSTNRFLIHLHDTLDKNEYDVPLTLRTYLPRGWRKVKIIQDTNRDQVDAQHDARGSHVMYRAKPNAGVIEIVRAN